MSDSEGEIFEVDYIMDQRGKGKSLEYFVRWKGFGDEEDSWEPARNMKHAKKKVDEWLKGKTPGKTPAKKSSTSTKQATQQKRGTTTKTVTTTYSRSDASSPESSPVLTRRTTTTSKRVEVTQSRGGGSKSRRLSLRERMPDLPRWFVMPRICRAMGADTAMIVSMVLFFLYMATFVFEKQLKKFLEK